jgi:hypothetical protein
LIRKPAVKGGRPLSGQAATPVSQAFPLVRRALKILADREVSPQTGLLKSTLLQLDSTFSERNYGASSFLDFVEKLAQAGLVQLKHAGRSVMVELNSGFDESEGAGAPDTKPRTDVTPSDGAIADQRRSSSFDARSSGAALGPAAALPGETQGPQSVQAAQEIPVQAGTNADGVRLATEILKSAVNARWPMYLRNVRQVFRAAGFDERRYGFGGLIDLLRACGREGFIQLERDRRGGLRAFQGPALVRTAQAPEPVPLTSEPLDAPVEPEPAPTEGIDVSPTPETDVIDTEPISVVDTTAELLGRARQKRSRSRTTPQRSSSGVAARKPTPKKPAVRARSRRSSKTTHPTGE